MYSNGTPQSPPRYCPIRDCVCTLQLSHAYHVHFYQRLSLSYPTASPPDAQALPFSFSLYLLPLIFVSRRIKFESPSCVISSSLDKSYQRRGERKMLFPCDFCDSKMAVLFCRADSAKLCLLCDQHVHSANALSLKHVRFKICDTCNIETATVRCSTDNLMLCQHCDWEAHNNNTNNTSSPSPLHERTPTPGFSGCPSIFELASLLGLDFQGRVVPNCNSSVSSALSEGQNLMYEQIVEMGRRNSGEEDGAGPLGLELNNEKDDVLVQQQTPFTSLLMLPGDMDVRKNGGAAGGHLPWDSSPTRRATKVCSPSINYLTFLMSGSVLLS